MAHAQVDPVLTDRLAQARLDAPAAVNAWVDELGHDGMQVFGLARIHGGAWCVLSLDEVGLPAEPRCLSVDEDSPPTLDAWRREAQSPAQIFQAQRARAASERGAMSEGLHRHLDGLTAGTKVSATVWARFEAPVRARGAALDVESLQAGLLVRCAAHPECAASPLPGAPAIEVEAPPGVLRQLARQPMVGAMDWHDPSVRFAPEAPIIGYMTMECIEMDDADALFTADGSGVKIAVLEGGLPDPVLLAKVTNYADTNCPAVNDAWHAGRVLSVLGADSQGLRAIDGSAAGAQLLVAGRSEACFPCVDASDCWAGAFCTAGTCVYSEEKRHYAALQWAVDEGADVINASLGVKNHACLTYKTDLYDSLSRILDYRAISTGLPVIVKSTGNGGNWKISTGTTYNGIVVGGVDHADSLDRGAHQIWDDGWCTSGSHGGPVIVLRK